MVTTALKLSEISNPSRLALAQHEKSTSQYSNHIPLISVIPLRTRTKAKAWMADITS